LLLNLINEDGNKIISRTEIEEKLREMNLQISTKIKQMTISGDSLFAMLSKQHLPPELETIRKEELLSGDQKAASKRTVKFHPKSKASTVKMVVKSLQTSKK
jgi:hypothetical protein